MRVYKFGGASVKSAEAVRNVGHVLNFHGKEPVLVIVSAMGKTTNKLEELARAYFNHDPAVTQLCSGIRDFHQEIINGLLSNTESHTYDDIDNLFVELECLLESTPENSFDYIYDQIVSYGEIISSRIVSAYLNESGYKNRWIDARNFVITNNKYREAGINWKLTTDIISKKLLPIVKRQSIITQGFIGRAGDLSTTTLGREGSDYSAAIFAYGLGADSVTIWKDVAGVMNADPKRFPDAVKIDELSYSEAIELAYYGATVIHPKTIQPLQSSNIPLLVKSFINPEQKGTIVSNDKQSNQSIANLICKPDQVLLSISSRDFSFIVEENLSTLFAHFASNGIKINLMQNSAISFSVCADYHEEKIDKLSSDLSSDFNISIQKDLELLTISNYDDQSVSKVVKSKNILLEQKTMRTIQFVVGK